MIEERGSENSIMEYKKREMKLSKQRYLFFFYNEIRTALYPEREKHLLKKVVILDNNTCAYNFCKIFFLGFHQVSR